MNPSIYVPIIMLWLIIFTMNRNRRNAAIVRKAIEKRKTGDKNEMKELAERFVGKECLIYSFDGSHQFVGVIKEVTDGAILVDKKGTVEAINLDFVMRIREYPRKKNGKKASVVID